MFVFETIQCVVVRYDIALDSGKSYMEMEKELFPCLCNFGYKSPQ